MKTPAFTVLTQLPSIHAFIDRIANDISDNRSVIVYLPMTIDPTWLIARLEAELWEREFAFEQIDVDSLALSNGAVEALAEALGAERPTPFAARTIASLVNSEGLPEVVILSGIESLEQGAQETWFRLIAQWSQVSQNLPGRVRSPSVLLVVLQPALITASLIDSDVRLAVHWWWGFPSILELRLLCRLATTGQPNALPVDRWQEHLLPDLVGGDVALLDQLWNTETSDTEQMLSQVKAVAQNKGWTSERLHQWGLVDGQQVLRTQVTQPSEAPPSALRTLWAQGALYSTEEHGIELHTAALAILGRHHELRHRLWRGQAELVLPILDNIRLELCNYLTRQYGNDWPVKWDEPDHPDEASAVRENPLACGWGHLGWLIRKCSGLQSERRWLSLITSAAQIRNEIAHYRTITRSDFEHVFAQYRSFVRARLINQ